MARVIPNVPEIEGSLDGRVRRGARNRVQILDALYALIQSGEIQPTAEQVARKAGVGARTVFRHFEDMERLNAEMSMRVERSVRPLFEAPPVRGSLEERVRALVKGRVQLWEKIAPFRRSGMAWEGRSEVLRKNRLRMNRLMRGSLVEALGPEIEPGPDALLEALDLLLSFETWERLRAEQRLGRTRATQVVEATLFAVLGALK